MDIWSVYIYIYLKETPFFTAAINLIQCLSPFLSVQFGEINHRNRHFLKLLLQLVSLLLSSFSLEYNWMSSEIQLTCVFILKLHHLPTMMDYWMSMNLLTISKIKANIATFYCIVGGQSVAYVSQSESYLN